MKIVKTVLLVLFTTLFYSTQLHAQNTLFDVKDLSINIQIDNYSDDELTSMLKKQENLAFTVSTIKFTRRQELCHLITEIWLSYVTDFNL